MLIAQFASEARPAAARGPDAQGGAGSGEKQVLAPTDGATKRCGGPSKSVRVLLPEQKAKLTAFWEAKYRQAACSYLLSCCPFNAATTVARVWTGPRLAWEARPDPDGRDLVQEKIH